MIRILCYFSIFKSITFPSMPPNVYPGLMSHLGLIAPLQISNSGVGTLNLIKYPASSIVLTL